MAYTRAVVESILHGTWHASHASIEPHRLSDLAEIVRDAYSVPICADPLALAESMGIAVQEAALPGSLCVCVEASAVIVRPEDDPQERGLLVFRGLARRILARRVGAHTEVDAVILAAELAAPSGIVIRRGIESVIAMQPWAPEWFLRAWDAHLCPPVSATRIA